MAGEKNFNIKNGLSVQGTEVIQSDGTYVGSISATALNENSSGIPKLIHGYCTNLGDNSCRGNDNLV